MAVAIPCPKCRAVMRSAAPVPAGQKVKCPKCHAVFAAPGGVAPNRPSAAGTANKPVAASRPSAAGTARKPVVANRPSASGVARPRPSATGAPAVDFAALAASVKSPPAPRRRRRGRFKLILALVMLLALAGGGFWVYSQLAGTAEATGSQASASASTPASAPTQAAAAAPAPVVPKSSDDPLAYLPADCTMIAGIEPARLLQIPLMQANAPALLASPGLAPAVAELKRLTGLAIEDLERCVIAGTGPLDAERPILMVVVARTRAPVDMETLGRLPDVVETRKGAVRSYCTLRSSALTQPYALRACCTPTDRLVVLALGPEKQVVALMDQAGAAPTLPAELKPLLRQAETSQFWTVMPLDDALRQQMEAAAPAAVALAPDLDAPARLLAQSRAAGVWIRADPKEITVAGGVICPSAMVAGDITRTAGEQWAKMKQPVQDQLQPALQQMPAELRDLVGELFASAAVNADGELAQVSVRVSMTPLEGLVKMVQAQGPAGLLASLAPAQPQAAPAGAAQHEATLLTLVNKERADQMVALLKPDARLHRAAASLARAAAQAGNFDGVKTPQIDAAGKEAGYPSNIPMANIAIIPAMERVNPELAIMAWMKNDRASTNILNRAYTVCGLGMATSEGGEVFVVLLFAR